MTKVPDIGNMKMHELTDKKETVSNVLKESVVPYKVLTPDTFIEKYSAYSYLYCYILGKDILLSNFHLFNYLLGLRKLHIDYANEAQKIGSLSFRDAVPTSSVDSDEHGEIKSLHRPGTTHNSADFVPHNYKTNPMFDNVVNYKDFGSFIAYFLEFNVYQGQSKKKGERFDNSKNDHHYDRSKNQIQLEFHRFVIEHIDIASILYILNNNDQFRSDFDTLATSSDPSCIVAGVPVGYSVKLQEYLWRTIII